MHNSFNYNEPVYINIYDLHKINNFIWYFGLGIFHTGIEMYGTEYSYGLNGGIYGSPPKSVMNLPLRETIYLGNTNKSYSEIYNIILDLKNDFKEENYNVLNKNCNHFCETLSDKIVGTKIPKYIGRLTSFGKRISCIIPSNLDNYNNQITYNNYQVIDIEAQKQEDDYYSEGEFVEIKIDDEIDYINNYNHKID